MVAELRQTGIDLLGEIPWGSHFCLFYETREDLLDLLIPYFKTGLANHEFCLCVASEPVIAEQTERALRQSVPNFDLYLNAGQIEIVSHLDWYLAGGRFDPLRVRQGWLTKLEQALKQGYAGMRFAANIFWLEKQDWDTFAEYEGKLDEVFGKSQIIALCAYSLARCSAADMLDAVRHHQFSLARRHGHWEQLEGPELQRAHAQVRKLNAELERRIAERTAQLAAANEQLTGEIAERKRSEEALRASEFRLQAAIDAAEIGLWDWDLVSGQIIWLGHHEKLFGLAAHEFDGTYSSFEKRVHPEDLDELNRVVRHARDNRSEYAHEYRVIWPDGSIHWIAGRGRFVYEKKTGEPVRMYGGVLDITERKQAEEALRQSEFDLAESQRLARLGSWSFDIAANTVHWSEELYRIFDIEKPDFDGSYETFLSRVHPDDRSRVLQANAEARSTGKPFDVEYRIITRGGQLKHIREVGYARKDRTGAVSKLFGTAQDITERKQAEQELRTSREQLRALAAYLQSVREAERTRIARELHDEIGQPLTAIKFALERSIRDPSVGDPANLAQALALANELIGRARDLSLELRPAMLDDLGLLAVLRWHFDRYTNQFKISVDFKQSGLENRRFAPEIETTAYRIVQEALTNVARHANTDKVEVYIDADETALRIRVKDLGLGFDMDSMSATKTGGLSGMRERAMMLGGQLSLDSAPGRGTFLRVELPL